jgi:hypothetical protein
LLLLLLLLLLLEHLLLQSLLILRAQFLFMLSFKLLVLPDPARTCQNLPEPARSCQILPDNAELMFNLAWNETRKN